MGRSQKTLPLIVIFIGVLSVVFLSQIFSNDFRIKVLNIFRTPLKILSGSYYALRDVKHFKKIMTENRILTENIENLEKNILTLRETRLENERLRELLGLSKSKSHKFIPCMVIARDSLGLRDVIIIDKGKKDKVQKNMVVISGNGLVGRVRECGWSISRVLLVTDRDSALSGIVQRTRDEGLVAGTMRQGLIMKYLALDCDVRENDKVISSGFGGIFEKGLLIGRVVSIEKDASGLYLNAVVEPEVDMERLEEVLVMQ